MSKTLQQMLEDAQAKVRDLEQRIAQNQGVPTYDDVQDSSVDGSYHRQTRKLRWRIYCAMCETANAQATRYPGGIPSLCDSCLAKYANANSARVALSRKRKKRDVTKLANYHDPYQVDDNAYLGINQTAQDDDVPLPSSNAQGVINITSDAIKAIYMAFRGQNEDAALALSSTINKLRGEYPDATHDGWSLLQMQFAYGRGKFDAYQVDNRGQIVADTKIKLGSLSRVVVYLRDYLITSSEIWSKIIDKATNHIAQNDPDVLSDDRIWIVIDQFAKRDDALQSWYAVIDPDGLLGSQLIETIRLHVIAGQLHNQHVKLLQKAQDVSAYTSKTNMLVDDLIRFGLVRTREKSASQRYIDITNRGKRVLDMIM